MVGGDVSWRHLEIIAGNGVEGRRGASKGREVSSSIDVTHQLSEGKEEILEDDLEDDDDEEEEEEFYTEETDEIR